jgi:hypothetical protein
MNWISFLNEAQEKRKTRNVARVEALRKNESQLKFAAINLC